MVPLWGPEAVTVRVTNERFLRMATEGRTNVSHRKETEGSIVTSAGGRGGYADAVAFGCVFVFDV